jgi:hypothetical protein
MKQLIILTILLFASWQGNGQSITGNHCYRIGDNVEKHIVAYAAEAEDAQPVVWDIRDMEICGGKHCVSYTEVYGKEQLVAGIENNTLHYYEQAHDSLLAWGYENNLTKTVYNRPMMLLHTLLVYGKQHSGLFHGRMDYCERMFSRVCGSWTVKVNFDLTEDATVKGLISNVSGIMLRQQSRHHEAGRGYEMELDCSGLSRGEYVLYMNVNGIVESYTVSL